MKLSSLITITTNCKKIAYYHKRRNKIKIPFIDNDCRRKKNFQSLTIVRENKFEMRGCR